MKTQSLLAPFIFGILLTVFSFQAYNIYQLRSQVKDDHATLTQVIGFLNNQIQVAQQAAQAQQPAKPTVAPSTSNASTTKK